MTQAEMPSGVTVTVWPSATSLGWWECSLWGRGRCERFQVQAASEGDALAKAKEQAK
jgi:hypothetical protein